jgi:hypothetical protein
MKKVLFFIPVLLILLFWINSILNINDHLYDWNDTLYTIWLIQNNLDHFKTLDFKNLYETGAMYPFKYSLSFAEHLFFPSLLLLPLSFFINNPIAQMNIYLVFNHVMVFVSFFLLAGVFVKNFWAKLISAFYISFSPYFFTQLGHIHMLSFWPLLISLYFLFKDPKEKTKKNLLLSGLFLGLQFTTGAYPGIMGFAIVNIYFLTRIFFEKKYKQILKDFLTVVVIFFITAGVSIYGYYIAKQEYGGHRDIREFLIYSAHLSDYVFFPRNQNSFLYSNDLTGIWQKFNQHNYGETAAFLGFIPLVIIVLYLFKFKKDQGGISLSLGLNPLTFFLMVLLVAGFIFSLGPRLHVNGQYVQIPLPYYAILKLPFIESLRALARWSFLLFLSAGLLVALGLDKYLNFVAKKYSTKTSGLVAAGLFLIFVLEFYPAPLKATTKYWWDDGYQFMKTEICPGENPAVLEYPFVYRNYDADIMKDLQYKTNILLASTQHKCKILSGFSGYEPDRYIDLRNRLDSNLGENEINELKSLSFSYVKINKLSMLKEESEALIARLKEAGLNEVYDDHRSVILKIPE